MEKISSKKSDSSIHSTAPISRRAARRDPYLCLAFVRVIDEDEPKEGIARTVDISTMGIGLILAHELAVGAKVVVDVVVLGTLCLRATGTVAHRSVLHRDQYRLGIAFDAPPALIDVPSAQKEG